MGRGVGAEGVLAAHTVELGAKVAAIPHRAPEAQIARRWVWNADGL